MSIDIKFFFSFQINYSENIKNVKILKLSNQLFNL